MYQPQLRYSSSQLLFPPHPPFLPLLYQTQIDPSSLLPHPLHLLVLLRSSGPRCSTGDRQEDKKKKDPVLTRPQLQSLGLHPGPQLLPAMEDLCTVYSSLDDLCEEAQEEQKQQEEVVAAKVMRRPG